MLELLSDHLKQAAPPEQYNEFQVLCDALDKIGLEGYEDAIEQIILEEDMVDAGDVLFQLTNLLRAHAHQVLRMHAISFTEDASLGMLGEVINGIVDLPDHEERKHIVAIAEADSNIRERFCDLMAIVTSYQQDVLLHYVVSVSPSFMTKIVDLAEEEMDEAVFAVQRQEKISLFQIYSAYLPEGMPVRIGQMLRHGSDVGMPYTVYAGVIGTDFEQMPPEQIAEEMFGIALVSSDGSAAPVQTIKDHLEEYIANPDTIVAVMTRVNKINVEFKP